MAQRLQCLPAMWETCVRSLGREDPLEKEMATHSSIIAWRIPWTEEPGGSTGVAKSQLHFHFQETKIPGDAVKKKKKMQRKVNAYSRVSEYSQSKLILFPSTHIWFEVLNFFLDSSCKNVPSIPYCDCVILSLNCFTLATTREEFLICLSSYWTVWLHYTYGVQKTGIN